MLARFLLVLVFFLSSSGCGVIVVERRGAPKNTQSGEDWGTLPAQIDQARAGLKQLEKVLIDFEIVHQYRSLLLRQLSNRRDLSRSAETGDLYYLAGERIAEGLDFTGAQLEVRFRQLSEISRDYEAMAEPHGSDPSAVAQIGIFVRHHLSSKYQAAQEDLDFLARVIEFKGDLRSAYRETESSDEHFDLIRLQRRVFLRAAEARRRAGR